MILEVFAMFDVAVKAYTQPFYLHSTEEAIRAIRNEAQQADSKIGRNPNDFIMYRLGTYDNISGMFTQDKNERIGSVHELTMLENNGEELEYSMLKGVK